jgi:diguanylate cyclase (GGDEF)-like protein
MLDLDHFKDFNDCHGHEAGDAVLRAIGDLLQQFLRSSDIACRYGGEELTLILPGAPLIDAWSRMEALRQAVADLHLRDRAGALPAITVSIGLAEATADTEAAAILLARADAALYRAKQQGRNRVVCAEI